MNTIGGFQSELEGARRTFSVEALAQIIWPSWIEESLLEGDRCSTRIRALPADFMMWFMILLALFRHLSYQSLLVKFRDSFWGAVLWKNDKFPTSSAVTKARDRLGVEPMRLLFHPRGRHRDRAVSRFGTRPGGSDAYPDSTGVSGPGGSRLLLGSVPLGSAIDSRYRLRCPREDW